MKKVMVTMLFILSSPVMAGGPYDGVWNTQALGFISLHENNGQVIAIRLEKDLGFWEAGMGPRNGTAIRLESIVSNVTSAYNVTMTSDTTFTAVLESCTPVSECLLPDGYTFTGIKIF